MAVAALDPDRAYGLSGPSRRDLARALRFFIARIRCARRGLLAAGYPQAWAAHVTVTASTQARTVTHVPRSGAAFGEAD
jgi:hypothetical protein